MSELEIQHAEDVRRIRACWPVMVQLRPHLEADAFVEQVLRQRVLGYRLVMGCRGSRVVVVAGYTLGEKLAWGRHLYVDDLVTDGAARSEGAGALMLDWLRRHAIEAGCASLHLDSGLQRVEAHRFYRREGLAQTSAHFTLSLSESHDRPPSVPVDRAREALLRLRAGVSADDTRASPGGPTAAPVDHAIDAPGDGFDAGIDDDDFDPSHEGGLDPDFR